MSTLRFAGGAYNHAQGTRDAFGRLSDRLVAEGLPPMTSVSGDREKADQLRIWYDRMTLTPGRRHVYGTAWWQGKTWYRIHPDAVAVPDTSNHEKRRSNDLAWPYNSNTAAHRRAQQLAPAYNITCDGMGFREWWHWTHWGPLGAIGAPAGGGSSTDLTTPDRQEDDDMATLITGGGQTLVIGNKLIGLSSEQIPSIKGVQVIEVHPVTHHNIIQTFQRDGHAGEYIVNVYEGGNGTRYLLAGGELTALVDNRTIDQLVAKGVPAIDLSQAEVDNLLKK